jgi:predicted alpha/beta-hydrolase family hydrolase
LSNVSHSAGAAALIELQIGTSGAPVSALYFRPAHPQAMLVFAHGAGAGMRHGFMAGMAERLAARNIATLRFQFPYMERGGQRPDRQAVMVSTVRAAVEAASRNSGKLPLFAGGKSMGGRMTSLAEAAEPLDVRGIIFFGFPLHAAGSRDIRRAEHLTQVRVPMLFLQGTRDDLAPLELLQPIIMELGERATLHVIEGADHSFRVPRRSGRSDDQVLDELADTAAGWIARVSE